MASSVIRSPTTTGSLIEYWHKTCVLYQVASWLPPLANVSIQFQHGLIFLLTSIWSIITSWKNIFFGFGHYSEEISSSDSVTATSQEGHLSHVRVHCMISDCEFLRPPTKCPFHMTVIRRITLGAYHHSNTFPGTLTPWPRKPWGLRPTWHITVFRQEINSERANVLK